MRFRVEQVDEVIWNWIRSLLPEPETLQEGLIAQREKLDRGNAPIRERLEVVDDLLDDNRRQLERLVDLYLTSDFPKDVLMDRKDHLESTIRHLRRSGPSCSSDWNRGH